MLFSHAFNTRCALLSGRWKIIHWHDDDHTNSCKIFCNQLHGIFMLLNYIVINLIERK